MQVKAGVGVVIKKNNKVLIGKRTGSHGSGNWAFPGGHIEFGETFKQTAEREVLEETGMEIECIPVDPNGRFEICTTLDVLTEDKQYVTTYLFAHWKKGTPNNLEPHKCLGWHWETLNNIQKMDISTMWIPIREIIAYRELMKL